MRITRCSISACRLVLSALFVFGLASDRVLAQTETVTASVPTPLSSLSSGLRVRVTAVGLGLDRQTAAMVAATADTLRVVPEGSASVVAIPTAAVTELDITTGRHGQARKGMLIGLGIGVVTGAISGYASGDDPPEAFLAMTADDKARLGAVGLGALGLGVGALVGHLMKRDDWHPVATPLRLTLAPHRTGIVLQFAIGR